MKWTLYIARGRKKQGNKNKISVTRDYDSIILIWISCLLEEGGYDGHLGNHQRNRTWIGRDVRKEGSSAYKVDNRNLM